MARKLRYSIWHPVSSTRNPESEPGTWNLVSSILNFYPLPYKASVFRLCILSSNLLIPDSCLLHSLICALCAVYCAPTLIKYELQLDPSV